MIIKNIWQKLNLVAKTEVPGALIKLTLQQQQRTDLPAVLTPLLPPLTSVKTKFPRKFRSE